MITKDDLQCKCGCGLNIAKEELIDLLNEATEIEPEEINSGCRCPAHNAEVGGAKKSAHLTGEAADIKAEDIFTRFRLVDGLLTANALRLEIKPTWVHVDIAADKDHPQMVIIL